MKNDKADSEARANNFPYFYVVKVRDGDYYGVYSIFPDLKLYAPTEGEALDLIKAHVEYIIEEMRGRD